MKFQTLFQKPTHIFYGWWMVAVVSALRILGGGLYYFGFTVFFLPLSQDLGLSRAATSLVFSLARAEGAFEAPLAGYFIDRFGPRPLMITSILLTGIGYMLLSGVHSYFALLLVYTGVVSLSFHAGFMDAPMVMANTWFIRRRTMAMAVVSGSFGIGGFLLTPLLAAAIHGWGWRRAAVACGVIFLVAGLPLTLFVRRSPESMGLRPDGDPIPTSRSTAQAGKNRAEEQEVDFTLGKALRTSSFWLLTIGSTFRILALSATTVHYVPIMVWKGLSEQHAAFLLAVQTFLLLPSHVLFGWIADRVNKPRLIAVCMVFATAALLVLIYGEKEWQIWLFVLLYSLVEASFPIHWSAVGEFFGRSNFAKIRGVSSFFQTWGAVIGPVVAGAIYDGTQSYRSLLWVLAGILMVVSVLYAMVVGPSSKATDRQTDADL